MGGEEENATEESRLWEEWLDTDSEEEDDERLVPWDVPVNVELMNRQQGGYLMRTGRPGQNLKRRSRRVVEVVDNLRRIWQGRSRRPRRWRRVIETLRERMSKNIRALPSPLKYERRCQLFQSSYM